MRHLASYIQALSFAVLFLLYINGSVGWAIIYVIVFCTVLFISTLIASRKNVTCELQNLSGISENKGATRLRLTVRKTGFCFLPFIDVYLLLPDGETLCVRTGLTFNKESTHDFEVTNIRSGLGKVAVKEMMAQDLWSAWRLRINTSAEVQYPVLPQFIDYIGPDVPIKTLPSEDDDAEEGRTVMSGGLPGYEHREYVAGDSMRRINYKLSAKLGRLMVRLDEETGTAPVIIAIDGYGSAPEGGIKDAGECALALSKQIVVRGGRVTVHCGGESFSAGTAQTIDKLREWLAFRDMSEGAQPAPAEVKEIADVIISGGILTVR